MLAVAPAAQGRGVGAGAGASSCLDRFREVGATAVVLSSLADMAAAHRMYERLGFERAPGPRLGALPGCPLHRLPQELVDERPRLPS